MRKLFTILIIFCYFSGNSQDLTSIKHNINAIISGYKYVFSQKSSEEELLSELNKYSSKLSSIKDELIELKNNETITSGEGIEISYLINVVEHLGSSRFSGPLGFECLTVMNDVFSLLGAKSIKRLDKNDIVLRIVTIGAFNIAYAYTKTLDTKNVTVGYSENRTNDKGKKSIQKYGVTYYLINGDIRIFKITAYNRPEKIYDLYITELEHKDFKSIFGPHKCKEEFPRN